jgi:SAM-dependent methyltransferase
MQPYVRVREIERRLIRAFGGRAMRDVEYDFTYRSITDEPLRILDIGGCQSLLPLSLAKRGHSVTVFDYRPYDESHPNLRVINGDFLKNELPSNAFDIVLLVSVIEHIGIGSYGASVAGDADFKVMEELKRILVPGGRVVITTPFNEVDTIVPDFERWYTKERLSRLFAGWAIEDCEFWRAERRMFGRWVKWIPSTRENAATANRKVGHQGLVCVRVASSENAGVANPFL